MTGKAHSEVVAAAARKTAAADVPRRGTAEVVEGAGRKTAAATAAATAAPTVLIGESRSVVGLVEEMAAGVGCCSLSMQTPQ